MPGVGAATRALQHGVDGYGVDVINIFDYVALSIERFRIELGLLSQAERGLYHQWTPTQWMAVKS
jgi:hypothetical protein